MLCSLYELPYRMVGPMPYRMVGAILDYELNDSPGSARASLPRVPYYSPRDRVISSYRTDGGRPRVAVDRFLSQC